MLGLPREIVRARWPKSGADGRFIIEGVPAEHLKVTANHEGLEPTGATLSAVEETVIVMPRSKRLEGTVVDEKTGEPIREFRVSRGWAYGDGFHRVMKYDCRDGRFEGGYVTRNDLSSASEMVRVEARGYETADTPLSHAALGPLVFRLKRDRTVNGVVRNSKGEPLQGVLVGAVALYETMSVANGQLEWNSSQRWQERTDEEGRFWLLDAPRQSVLVAVSDYGFATVQAKGWRYDLTLEPWATVKGKVTHGKELAEVRVWSPPLRFRERRNAFEIIKEIYRTRKIPKSMRGSEVFRFLTTVRGNANGGYVVERVKPGACRVERDVTINTGSFGGDLMYTETVSVDIRPGETKTVDFGGAGRPLRGRITMTRVTPAVICVEKPLLRLLPAPPERKVEGLEDAAGPAVAAQMVDEWSTSEDGQAFFAGKRIARIRPGEDGAFQINDVIPGKYWLIITLQARNIGEISIGRLVEVKEGDTGEPVDLGLLGAM
jgi:hypothetical protein